MDPTGGFYEPFTNSTYYETVASVFVRIIDSVGVQLDQIIFNYRTAGFAPEGIVLTEAFLLPSTPSLIELYFDGHDAKLNWSMDLYSLTSASPEPFGSIPEPTTFATVLLGGILLSCGQARKRKETETSS